MRPQEVESKSRTEPKGALPGAFLRLCWLMRVVMPTGVAAPVLWYIFASVTPTDFDTWLLIPWSTLLDGDGFEQLDIDLLAQNLITPNAVTKTLAATIVVLATFYITDLRTTGRRQGWHLVGHPLNASRLKEFFVWLLLFLLFVTVNGFVIGLRVKGLCKPETAIEFVLIGHCVTLFTLVLANRNFNAFLLIVPALEARRKERRTERLARQRERQRLRHEKQLEAKRERDRIRAQRAKIVELQEVCRRIDGDVAYLESSGDPPHLVDEQLAAMKLERSELESEIDRLTLELS